MSALRGTLGMLIASTLVVAGWGYFLYIGVIDPNGGVNILWPLFGIANQMLAASRSPLLPASLSSGKMTYAFVTACRSPGSPS